MEKFFFTANDNPKIRENKIISITISGGNASVFISNDRIRKVVQFVISLDIFDPAFVMFNAIAREGSKLKVNKQM